MRSTVAAESRREAIVAKHRLNMASWAAALVGVLVVGGTSQLPMESRGFAQEQAAQRAQTGAFCSSTAASLFRACGYEALDDYWKTVANCTNVSDAADRADCLAEARADRDEANALCQEQRSGRLSACRVLGENRYDPEFDPALFESNFRTLANPNRYFPLTIGNKWEYSGGNEVNTVEVLNRTKRIEGVTCVVFRDLVRKNGHLAEATDDWYAQAKDGNVWYCGEEVKDYETFAGDMPRVPELVSIDGSFKAGRDGDKPGIIFLAAPAKGDAYLEEFSLGNAEDVTEILSVTYKFGSEPELDRFVPRALVSIFCNGDCIVTRNYSLLEPGVFARKYYAPDIGVILEVDPTAHEVVQLTNCNFDARCAKLPKP